MSSATLGAPIGPEIESGKRRIVYDHIPRLHELLENGGWPGVTYAQACVHNVKNAADRAERPTNLRPIRGATYYSIQGPKGIADMALVGTGSPIQGAAPEAGARLFFTDGEVEILTGWPVEQKIWFRQEPRKEGRDVEVTFPSRADEKAPQEAAAPKVRKPMNGHTHAPNFGRIVPDCAGCQKLEEKRRAEKVL